MCLHGLYLSEGDADDAYAQGLLTHPSCDERRETYRNKHFSYSAGWLPGSRAPFIFSLRSGAAHIMVHTGGQIMTCEPRCRYGLWVRVLEKLEHHFKVEYRCVKCDARWWRWGRVAEIE